MTLAHPVPDNDWGWTEIRPGLDVATSVHLRIAEINEMAAELATASGHPVSVNGYRSTGGNFAPHRDEHDALILQVQGRRRWWLHPPTEGDEPPRPDRWNQLAPGAQLDLPAGWWHLASATTQPSVHLTFTLHEP